MDEGETRRGQKFQGKKNRRGSFAIVGGTICRVRLHGVSSVVLPRHPWASFWGMLNGQEAENLGQKMDHPESDPGFPRRRFLLLSFFAVHLVPTGGLTGWAGNGTV